MDSFTGKSPHRPLSNTGTSEIRIVKLWPGEFGAPSHCELEHISLLKEDNLPFAAVSYCWGSPDNKHTIRLDGCLFPVTVNLYNFLQHVQSILLALSGLLPNAFQQRRKESVTLAQYIIHNLLNDAEFPLDLLSTSDATISSFVQRHVANILRLADERKPSRSTVQTLLEDRVFDPPRKRRSVRNIHLRLWIDALCINQESLAERSQQVQLMRSIYSYASHTIIWPQDAATPASVNRAAAELIHDIRISVKPHLDDEIAWYEVVDKIASDSFINPRMEAITALQQIFKQAWFGRMWIIQEIAVSKSKPTVLIGFHPVEWRFLTLVVFACVKAMVPAPMKPILKSDMKRMEILKNIEREHQASQQRSGPEHESQTSSAERLLQLLCTVAGQFEATNPHDYLYALLGIVGTDNIPSHLLPNYSVPFEQVYHRYTLFLLEETDDASFLPFHPGTLEGVPNWTPDWRTFSPKRNATGRPSFQTSQIELSKDGFRLSLEVIPLGTVDVVLYPLDIKADLESTSLFGDGRFLEEEEPAIADDKQVGDDSVHSILSSLLKVVRGMQHLKELCFSNLSHSSPNALMDEFDCHWRSFWTIFKDPEWQPLCDILDKDRAADMDLEVLLKLEEATVLIMLGYEIMDMATRGLGMLESGGMVTVSHRGQHVCVGDMVCVVAGISQPCILRPAGRYYSCVSIAQESSFADKCGAKNLWDEASVRRVTLV